MTNERRQDAVLIALTASLVVHALLMVFIKPQIMASVTRGDAGRTRGPMTVRERAAVPEPVRMEAVRDLDALRDSPAAETDSLIPVTAAFTAPETLVDAAPAEGGAPEAEALPSPGPEFAPFMSEKIHIDSDQSPFVTPIAPASAPVAAPVAAAPEVALPLAPSAEIPLFTAPVYIPEVTAEDRSLALTASAPDPFETFVPQAGVLAQVDEKIVEAEKAAVRDLLDVARASDLDAAVTIVPYSANEGEWTYFRVKMLPKPELATVPKDVVVLMDASGSIGNDRLASCRTAAQQILRSVSNTGDRFNLVAFRDRFSYCFDSWQDCTRESFAAADKWLSRLAAFGRTDVFATIRSVLTLPRDPTRPLIAMVVTDGDANSGVSRTAQILSRFTALNDGLVSVYMYGVKADANRELIDVLTHGNRGESFIFGGSRWNAGRALSSLSERFRDPVLSDLRLVFASGTEVEAYPRLLRNLYRGEAVDLVGRVPKGVREVAFSVKGLNGKNPYEGFFRIDLSGAAFDARLPDSWRAEQAIDRKLR